VAKEENDEGGSGGGVPGFFLPVVTAGMALLAGAALGGLVVWVAKPPVEVEKLVPRDLTEAELNAECAPLLAKVAQDLQAANDKVTTLVDDVKSKEAKVQELEAEMKKRGAKGAALVKELEAAKAELAAVKEELKKAIEEKEELVVELKKTLTELEDQKVKTKDAKEESRGNAWEAFVNGAQLEICEKGNRKKLGRCRETVVATFNDDMKAKYLHYMRSGQEEPSLALAEKEAELPQFAQFLDQENKILKDWYVLLCDPTLPEAEGGAPIARPAEDEPPEGGVPASGEVGDVDLLDEKK
jgi:hypothetical protein